MDFITKIEGHAAPWNKGQAAWPEAPTEAERDLGNPDSVATGSARGGTREKSRSGGSSSGCHQMGMAGIVRARYATSIQYVARRCTVSRGKRRHQRGRALPGLGEFETMRWRMSARKNACGDLPAMQRWRLYFRTTPTARKRLNNALGLRHRAR
jgi:hypothetical protein